jgi:hypothetical protein
MENTIGFIIVFILHYFSVYCWINYITHSYSHVANFPSDNLLVLDKEATSYNDIFDAFRLALKFYHYRDSSSD